MKLSQIIPVLSLSVLPFFLFAQNTHSQKPLTLITDTATYAYGYTNSTGDTVIPLGKYSMCFTEKFNQYAIVSIPTIGLVAIDRNEKILYQVFNYDNGPDPTSNGLFRIIQNSKIGYANAKTGAIVIQPTYTCAWEFQKGKAKVATNCSIKQEDEHSLWISEEWFYINKKGKRIPLSSKKQD